MIPATTDAAARRSALHDGYRKLNRALPTTMKGFSDLHRSAVADGALSHVTKELMAMSIGVATNCHDCITLHLLEAVRAGATGEEVMEAIGVGVLMGGGPASTAATYALEVLEQSTG